MYSLCFNFNTYDPYSRTLIIYLPCLTWSYIMWLTSLFDVNDAICTPSKKHLRPNFVWLGASTHSFCDLLLEAEIWKYNIHFGTLACNNFNCKNPQKLFCYQTNLPMDWTCYIDMQGSWSWVHISSKPRHHTLEKRKS